MGQTGGYTEQMCQKMKESERCTDVHCCGSDLCNQVDGVTALQHRSSTYSASRKVDTVNCYSGSGTHLNDNISTHPADSLCMSAVCQGIVEGLSLPIQTGGYTEQMCQKLKERCTEVNCCGADLCNKV